MTFSVTKKLGGFFPSMEKRMAGLMTSIVAGNSYAGLRASQHWHAMDALLQSKHNDAVRELGNRDLSVDATKRLNHRLELLRELEDDMVAAIRRGQDAQDRYTKLKEKEQRHGRGTESTI